MNDLTISKSNSWHYKLCQRYSKKRCQKWEDRGGDIDICEYGKAFILASIYAIIAFPVLVVVSLLVKLVSLAWYGIKYILCIIWKSVVKIRFFIFIISGILLLWCNFAYLYFIGFCEQYDKIIFTTAMAKFNEFMPIDLNIEFIYYCAMVGIMLISLEFGTVLIFVIFTGIPYIFEKCVNGSINTNEKVSNFVSHLSTIIKFIREWILAKKGKYCTKIKIID
jgi:hypothetical protein